MGVIGAVLGGVGLFLLGMSLMTEGLKGVAGEGLRRRGRARPRRGGRGR
jgi:phosphate:Na+ symporter